MKTNNIIPIIHALLPAKTLAAYNNLFDVLRSRIPNLNPHEIQVYFVFALISSLKDNFPQANISDCFVPFKQSYTKKIK